MARRHGAQRRGTFYKVQKWDTKVSAWVDARKKTFDELAEAKDFLADQALGSQHRILQYVNGRFVEVS